MTILPSHPRKGYRITARAPWVTHPGATVQGWKRSIRHLKVIDNILYASVEQGWDGGPHPLTWVELDTGTPVTGPVQPSEGFRAVRQLSNGRIIFPWADPTGPWESPQGYTYSDNGAEGPWKHQLIAPAYHILDVREHGGVLWACGAGPLNGVQTAQVWKSTDGGDTWEHSFGATGHPQARIYSLIPVGDDLWIDPSGVDELGLRRLEGDEWVKHEFPAEGYQAGGANQWDRASAVGSANGVAYGASVAFDGTRFISHLLNGAHPGEVYYCWNDDTHVYAIPRSSTHVIRAPLFTQGEGGFVQWEDWLFIGKEMTAGEITCATLHNGIVYLGGSHGRIWRMNAPQ